jgi:outer membrane protein assembly factor BamB
VIRGALQVLAALAAVALGAAGAYLLDVRATARDVRGSSTVEFVTTAAPEPLPPPPPQRRGEDVPWPTYGYGNDRTRVSPYAHRPPFRTRWVFRARDLLEFPPAIAYGRLYFTNNSGVMFAVNARTGKRAWKKRIGRCVASSPAVARHRVFQSFLNAPPCNRNAPPGRLEGEVIAFASGFGKIEWRRKLGPTESSPLLAHRRVYVGDWRGDVYSLRERDGSIHWRTRLKGRVKGALASSGTRLFVGDYSGRLYSLNAKTGTILWEARSQDRLGGHGQFYSTPAVAYGRVYVGSTDGKVYSFGATSGQLRWSHDTGGFVYSSPAVWRQRVYAGSYSGYLYCFDAATGDVLWRFRANGEISGSPTVMDGLVYFSTLAETTYALEARTGKEVWRFRDGKYTPLVADRDRAYLVGHARVYAMVERR